MAITAFHSSFALRRESSIPMRTYGPPRGINLPSNNEAHTRDWHGPSRRSTSIRTNLLLFPKFLSTNSVFRASPLQLLFRTPRDMTRRQSRLDPAFGRCLRSSRLGSQTGPTRTRVAPKTSAARPARPGAEHNCSGSRDGRWTG